MEVIALLVGVPAASSLAYVAFQLKNANRMPAIRLEFDCWNAPWTAERRREIEDHVSVVLKQVR